MTFSKFVALCLFVILGCVPDRSEAQIVTLQNEYLRVTAKRMGAELISIKLLEDNSEYLWQGDSITWSDHAILQFPVIGNLKNDTYQYNGKEYEMMSHGFARVSDFEVIEKSDDKVIFQLKSNTSTKTLYPFDFVFRVIYRLEGKSINVSFEVLNMGIQDMYFSLGYHPGFNCPIKDMGNMEDYYLEFSEKESVNRLMMKANLIDAIQTNYLTEIDTIQLSKSIFQEDAIILKNIESTSLGLKNNLNNKSVTVTFGKIPYLGIWSPKKFGDFVCIEPWFGIPDTKNASGNLKNKEGIIQLAPKNSFDWDFQITIN